MAGRTVVNIYAYVIKRRTGEIRSGVTGGTICNGWQMINELTYADDVVVTICT